MIQKRSQCTLTCLSSITTDLAQKCHECWFEACQKEVVSSLCVAHFSHVQDQVNHTVAASKRTNSLNFGNLTNPYYSKNFTKTGTRCMLLRHFNTDIDWPQWGRDYVIIISSKTIGPVLVNMDSSDLTLRTNPKKPSGKPGRQVKKRGKEKPVAPLVVVPSDELHESISECNACLGVENAWPAVSDEVCGHNIIFCVSQNSLHLSIGLFPVRKTQNQLTEQRATWFKINNQTDVCYCASKVRVLANFGKYQSMLPKS